MSKTILLIDDDPETLNLVRLILENEGFQLIAAQSGQDGINLAQAKPPDLLLLDVMMPDMDGYEVCRQFRADPKLTSVPIIMFTAKSKSHDKQTGYLVGANDYLTKPTHPSELVERVEALLLQAQQTNSLVLPAEIAESEPEAVDVTGQSIQSPPFIGVMGATGGAGTTTVAINLAYVLANGCAKHPAGTKTILADFDLVQGQVAQYLNKPVKRGLHFFQENRVAPTLSQNVLPLQKNLDLLPMAPNIAGNHPTPSPTLLKEVGHILKRGQQLVVADLGRGITNYSRPILHLVDKLVLVLRPQRISLLAARRLIAECRHILLNEAQLYVIMFTFNQEAVLPQTAIEQSLKHPIHDIISMPQGNMAQAANQGSPLILSHPNSEPMQKFRKLAAQLCG